MFYCQTVWIVHMRRKYTIFNISSLFQKNSQEKRKKIKRRWVLTQNSRVLFVRETSLSHLPLGSGVLTLEKGKQGCVRLLIVDCWALLRLEPIVIHESCYSLPRSILLISGNIHLSLTLNSSSSFLCVYLPPSKLSVVHVYENNNRRRHHRWKGTTPSKSTLFVVDDIWDYYPVNLGQSLGIRRHLS
jgi:hypothetical protein